MVPWFARPSPSVYFSHSGSCLEAGYNSLDPGDLKSRNFIGPNAGSIFRRSRCPGRRDLLGSEREDAIGKRLERGFSHQRGARNGRRKLQHSLVVRRASRKRAPPTLRARISAERSRIGS